MPLSVAVTVLVPQSKGCWQFLKENLYRKALGSFEHQANSECTSGAPAQGEGLPPRAAGEAYREDLTAFQQWQGLLLMGGTVLTVPC